uniref:Uncharacterized protein n=1 Tax=Sphaerodactylus townsendi TaxID=933632 RepID=A0ACB8EGJ4_9SAUR
MKPSQRASEESKLETNTAGRLGEGAQWMFLVEGKRSAAPDPDLESVGTDNRPPLSFQFVLAHFLEAYWKNSLGGHVDLTCGPVEIVIQVFVPPVAELCPPRPNPWNPSRSSLRLE